jgi:two-component system response regulator NreC
MKDLHTSKITVIVADSNEIYLSGLITTIQQVKCVSGICSAQNMKELFTISSNINADLICLDMDMPQVDNKFFIERIKKRHIKAKILLTSNYCERNLIRVLFKSGAHGFISKNGSIEQFKIAIYEVLAKGYYLGKEEQDLFSKDLLLSKQSTISDKVSRELLYLISHGFTSKQIAQCLLLSEKAIEYHRTNLLKSIGARNMTGLAVYAVQNNIYTDEKLKAKYMQLI